MPHKSHAKYISYTPELVAELKALVKPLTRPEGVKALGKKLGLSERQARRAYAKYVEDLPEVETKPSGLSKPIGIETQSIRRDVWFIEPYYTLEIDQHSVRITSSSKHAKGRELSVFLNPYGYPKVKINNKGVLVHQLVAHVTLGPRPEGLVINHKDGDKTNNQPDNLEYVTIKENIHHAIEHGMHVASDPTRMPTYKDGRTIGRKAEYKAEWYRANRDRILAESKRNYQANKTN